MFAVYKFSGSPHDISFDHLHKRMNRLQNWVVPHEFSLSSTVEIDQAQLDISQQDGVDRCIFGPLHYEPSYAYPLLVWMHSSGDNERQLQRVMPLISMRNYVAVAPRGTGGDPMSPGVSDWAVGASSTELAEQHVLQCIDFARSRYNIATDRVFLAGYQDGGTMAFRLGMNDPNRFAAVVSIGGRFPVGEQPLLQLDTIRRLPLLIEHSRDSQQYSLNQVCADLRLFHTAGLNVTLRQYPCGDELTTKMLADINVWLMEIVTGVPSSTNGPCYRLGEMN